MLRFAPHRFRFCLLAVSFGLAAVSLTALHAQENRQTPPQDSNPPKPARQQADHQRQASAKKRLPEKPADAISLFDGKTMNGWEVSNFGGEGECTVVDGALVVGAGYPISGVNSTRTDLPKTNYEISLDAKKTEGIDFFCGLTFPVNDNHCTLIVGGWAGVVVGLSCIDDQDASDNDTRTLMKFEQDQWYHIRVKVEPKRIQCWIDDQRVVDQDLEGHKVSLRNETLPSRPLGICNFETTSHFKNIELKTRDVVETEKQSEPSKPQPSEPSGNSKSEDGGKSTSE